MSLRERLRTQRQPLLGLLALTVLNLIMQVGQQGFISGLAGVLYLFVLPGLLMRMLFGWKFNSFWERAIHVVGGSTAFVLFGGLLTNTLGALGHVSAPLGKNFLLPVLNALMLFAIGLAMRKKPKWPANKRKTRHFDSRQLLTVLKRVGAHLLPFIFPLLAAAGATTLNNGGSNTLVIILLLSIVLLVMSVIGMTRLFSESFLLTSIYCIGLSLLFMTSLRAWHITGYDINQEFQVFQLTKQPLFWSMSHLQDPYNACLSITILPTIVSQLVHVADEYIYKFLFQLLFALVPVGIYLGARRFAMPKIAFLASFFFIAQIWFFQGMPTLVRQEFGLLFFGLLLLTLFSHHLTTRSKYQLVGLYSAAMVMSHYSTSYIALGLLLLTYVLNRVGSFRWLVRRYKWVKGEHFTHEIVWRHLVFLAATIVIWNVAVTRTGGAFTQFIDKSASNINQLFTSTMLTNAIGQVLFTEAEVEDFHAYTAQESAEFRATNTQFTYYPDGIEADEQVQPTTFPEVKPRFGPGIATFGSILFKILKTFVSNIFVFAGVVYFWIAWRKRTAGSSEYIWLAVGGFVLLGLILVVPEALKEYNLERLYFQLLFVWAVTGVYGGLLVLKFLRQKRFAYTIMAGLYCALLLFYSGLVFNIVGGSALLPLNNYGEDYEKFYTHEEEVAGARWLAAHAGDSYIFANGPARNKLWAYGQIESKKIMINTMPSEIAQNAFVFQTNLNTVGRKGLYMYRGAEYPYTYPHAFVDDHKNLIYSAKTTRVYR